MIYVKVNRRVLFKGELGEWTARPPDEFRDAIKPGAKPEPWLKAIMVVLHDVLITGGQNVRITVLTNARGWDMKVVV